MSPNSNSETLPQATAIWSIPEYLQELLPEQLDLFVELIQLFLQDTSRGLLRLHEQMELGELAGADMAIHSLKGSSKQIGGLQMGGIADEMEVSLKDGDARKASADLIRIEAAFHLLRNEMETYLAKQARIQHTH